ncbi:MAG: TrkA C-terminal domain-containing protein [Phycisphaerales bacterium JB052]
MPLLALLIIVFIALVIVRIGSKALMMTGLSHDVADFQAISCFFGVGFTTSEAEMIVNHPARRKIASHLIIAGNIGLTGAMSTLVLTFVDNEPTWFDRIIPYEGSGMFFIKLGLILASVLIIGGVFRMRITKALLDRVIEASLRRFQQVRAIDYETVLRSGDGFSVMQVEIESGNELIGSTLAGAALGTKGVLVLNIMRHGGESIGAPHPTTELMPGDLLTVYGQEALIPVVLGAEPKRKPIEHLNKS